MAKRAHTILAEHFSMDSADVMDNRYHYGHTTTPVYTLGADYYAVNKTKPTDDFGTGWTAIATHEGRTIWESKA